MDETGGTPGGAGRATPVTSVLTTGVIGLGTMGSVLAENLAAAGCTAVTHDVSGRGRSPGRATFVTAVADVARVGALRSRRTRSRLHPHLPLRRGGVNAGALP